MHLKGKPHEEVLQRHPLSFFKPQTFTSDVVSFSAVVCDPPSPTQVGGLWPAGGGLGHLQPPRAPPPPGY